MIFRQTKLKDAFIIELECLEDERGFFARSWDDKIFGKKNLASKIVQANISFNKKKGTIRGLHYQLPPYEEAKLVRCTRGKIFDVIIDLRPKSSTFKKWVSFELSSEKHRSLYVPEGFAHGFQTMEDNSEIFYQVSQYYMPEYERGIRWDDPTFQICWPNKQIVISKKDSSYPPFSK